MRRYVISLIVIGVFLAFIPKPLPAGWTKKICDAFAVCVKETADGDFVALTTQTRSWGKLYKVNASGDSIWAQYHNFTNITSEDMCLTPDGGVLVTGEFFFYDQYPYNEYDLLLYKVNSNGDSMWVNSYDLDYHPTLQWNTGHCIEPTTGGGFILTGKVGSYSNGHGVWLLKLTSDGDTLWTREYGRFFYSRWARGYFVQETFDKGFIVCAARDDSVEKDSAYFWLLKTDSLGDTLWTKKFTNTNHGTIS